MGDCNQQFKKKNMLTSLMYGGIGYGSVCVPHKITDMLIIIAFPPLYVILEQRKQNKYNFKEIFLNLFLTSLFYFPGFIHALNILKTKKKP